MPIAERMVCEGRMRQSENQKGFVVTPTESSLKEQSHEREKTVRV